MSRRVTDFQVLIPGNERVKANEEVYVVYETIGEEDRYKICRLDSGETIVTLKSSNYPINMAIFSVGKKIYFCGGVEIDPNGIPLYTCKAYMFDLKEIDGIVSSIESMSFPKRFPLLFGPIDDYKYYVFSSVRRVGISFEMLDTIINQWKTLPIPPHFTPPLGDPPSALRGSNILILPSPLSPLYVFCTTSEVWRVINTNLFPDKPNPLPFRKSVPLFRGMRHRHIFLASYRKEIPRLYTSHDLSMLSLTLDAFTPFEDLGELDMSEHLDMREHLMEMPEFLGGWGIMENFFSLSHNCVCFLRTPKEGFSRDERYVVDVCKFSYISVEGPQIKVKVEISKTYCYQFTNELTITPLHIFAVNPESYHFDDRD